MTLGKLIIDWRLKTPGIEGTPAISPNGRCIAYASQRAGRSEVYVERFPELGDRRTISSDGGGIEIGAPQPPVKAALFGSRGWRPYDVAPDGRFVIITADSLAGDSRAIPIIVPNWQDELKRRVSAN